MLGRQPGLPPWSQTIETVSELDAVCKLQPLEIFVQPLFPILISILGLPSSFGWTGPQLFNWSPVRKSLHFCMWLTKPYIICFVCMFVVLALTGFHLLFLFEAMPMLILMPGHLSLSLEYPLPFQLPSIQPDYIIRLLDGSLNITSSVLVYLAT